MSTDTPIEGRRRFLQTIAATGGTLLVPGFAGSSASQAPGVPYARTLPGGLDPRNFIVHSEVPLALETRRSKIGSGVLTPVGRFFVRNNLPMPPQSIVAGADAWVLEIGGVNQEGSFTLAELKGLGLETEAAVIQCSGNGRIFFEHGPSGSEWGTGAAGCALWTGIRLRTLLQHVGGVRSGMKFLTSTGGDPLPEGMDRDSLVVERSIPIEKALTDALLAWEMNGAPIPLIHGGPLRLVVPGYYGVNSIKYVKRIVCTGEESPARIHRTGYRLRSIGEPGSSTQPSMWRMPVKSWVNGPGAEDTPALAGRVTFYGVALSGERGVRNVEVSLDLGKTWHEARLEGPDLGVNAWRAFSYSTTLPPGPHTIVSRATDTKGDTQPREREENERGYGHNGWLDAALTVTLVKTLPDQVDAGEKEQIVTADVETPRKDVVLSEAGRAGRRVFIEAAQPACGACHSLSEAGTRGVLGPDLDVMKPDFAAVESAVSGGVGVMPAYDASLTPEQIRDLSNYVVEATK